MDKSVLEVLIMKPKLLVSILLHLGFYAVPSIAQTQAAQVTLSLNEFEDLYSSAKLKDSERSLQDQKNLHEKEHQLRLKETRQRQHKDIFPKNFHVLQYTAFGSYNSSSLSSNDNNMAIFDMSMTIRIIEDHVDESGKQRWTMVPLIPNTTIASDWIVEIFDEGEEDGGSFIAVDPVIIPDVLLLRRDHSVLELTTSRAGIFRIHYKAYHRVVKSRNNIHDMVISQFLYPFTNFRFRVHGSNTARDFSVRPVEAFWRVMPQQTNLQQLSQEFFTDIQVILPLTTDRIEIRWLDASDEGKTEKHQVNDSSTQLRTDNSSIEKDADDTPQVTVTNEVMHSIGEGVVKSKHILEFLSTNDLSAPVLFTLHGPNVRILSIEGLAVQSWEIAGSSTNKEAVRLIWKRSHLESSATVLIQTETDRSGAEQEQLELPRIECQNVLRQVGHVGVTKEANVEVHEHSTKGGIMQCEPTEVSSKLHLNMDKPMVLSYKYLNPVETSIILNVQVHVAMETLEATIDRLHYKAVVTNTHVMHSLIVVMQSIKLQYLKLFGVPESSSMFTLLVNSVPAKPVRGKDQSIMVPLLVGLDAESANAGRSQLTSVELNYISTPKYPMTATHNGTLELSPPHMDLPISVLTTHLRLPKNYKYEFSGDFGGSSSDLIAPLPAAFSYQTGKRVVKTDYQFSFKDDNWPDSDDTKPQEAAVKIVAPVMGRSFYFNRLLVVGTQLALNATFSQPLQYADNISWWQKILALTS